jgi:hypothetical protein
MLRSALAIGLAVGLLVSFHQILPYLILAVRGEYWVLDGLSTQFFYPLMYVLPVSLTLSLTVGFVLLILAKSILGYSLRYWIALGSVCGIAIFFMFAFNGSLILGNLIALVLFSLYGAVVAWIAKRALGKHQIDATD